MPSALERRYRLILQLAYPSTYLASHEDEILSTLLDLAGADQTWPSAHESLSLVLAGLRSRGQVAREEATRDNWLQGMRAAILLLMCAFYWTATHASIQMLSLLEYSPLPRPVALLTAVLVPALFLFAIYSLTTDRALLALTGFAAPLLLLGIGNAIWHPNGFAPWYVFLPFWYQPAVSGFYTTVGALTLGFLLIYGIARQARRPWPAWIMPLALIVGAIAVLAPHGFQAPIVGFLGLAVIAADPRWVIASATSTIVYVILLMFGAYWLVVANGGSLAEHQAQAQTWAEEIYGPRLVYAVALLAVAVLAALLISRKDRLHPAE